jgi:hypothetical protein
VIDGVSPSAVSFDLAPANPSRSSPLGHPARDHEQPAPDRTPISNRARFLDQDQEGGLKRVLGFLRITQSLPADRQDHACVPLHEGPERCVGTGAVAGIEETVEQLTVRERRRPAKGVKGVQRT